QEPFEDVVLFSQSPLSTLQQAVLIEGTKTFADQFCLILQDPKTEELVYQRLHDSPYKKSWLQLFQHFIHDYNYAGALKLLEGLENNRNTLFIKLLLEVQQLRSNFSFEKAYEKLVEGKRVYKSSNLRLLQTEIILSHLVGMRGEQQRELEQ